MSFGISLSGFSEILRTDAPSAGREFHYVVFPKINNNISYIKSNFLPLSGGTVTGNTFFTQNLSATTIYSGSTDLSLLLGGGGGGPSTFVQDGINTFTGGTTQYPTVNITGASLDNIFVSGNSIFNTLSGGTISGGTLYSGSTPLETIITNLAVMGSVTYVQNGINTFTGGSSSLPSVNITGVSIDNLYVSGGSQTLNGLTANSLSDGSNPVFLYNNDDWGLGIGGEHLIITSSGITFNYSGNVNTGIFSLIGGFNNQNYSTLSLVLGAGNIVSGSTNFTIGTSNIIGSNSNNSTVLGQNNQINSSNGLMFGDSNILTGNESLVGGFGNNVSGINSFSFGSANIVSAVRSGAIGTSNLLQGYDSLIGGTNSTATTNAYNSIIFGELNYLNAVDGAILGKNNTNSGNYSSIIAGSANTLTSSAVRSSVLAGYGIIGTEPDTAYARNIQATQNLSASTYYSGSTPLETIILNIAQGLQDYNVFILTAGTEFTFTGIVNTVSINKSIGSSTLIILPNNPSTGDYFVVKDRKGDCALNPITISGGTYNIDGSSSVILQLSNRPSLKFLFDGEEYIII